MWKKVQNPEKLLERFPQVWAEKNPPGMARNHAPIIIDLKPEEISGALNCLQDQIDLLAKVVFQNRQGLDLLTAGSGGICQALGEECCFYANSSGIVRDKVALLKE